MIWRDYIITKQKDAYSIIVDIIKRANNKILIIDNYIDDSVLKMLAKKKNNVEVVILISDKSNLQSLDIKKFNKEYPVFHQTCYIESTPSLSKTKLIIGVKVEQFVILLYNVPKRKYTFANFYIWNLLIVIYIFTLVCYALNQKSVYFFILFASFYLYFYSI